MRRRQGFTLIEMLIVIAIVAVLLIISIIAWQAQVSKARDAQRKAHLQRLKIAFEDYYSDNECYPAFDILETCQSSQLNPYLDKIPCDPTTKNPYCYVTDQDNPDCFQNYRILSSLQFDDDPVITELGCDSEAGCGYEDICAIPGRDSGFNYGVGSGNVSIANPNMPQPSPTPSPSMLPTPSPGNYACDPTGTCNNYQNPEQHGCPVTFGSEVVCQQYCDYSPLYWCQS